MSKLKPEDVMRALECCAEDTSEACLKCVFGLTPPYPVCKTMVAKQALALLREKDAEIGRLNIELQAMRGAANSYKMLLETAQKDFLDYQADVQMEIDDARAEAITEFAERLKKFYGILKGKTVGGSVEYHIDQIAKEMKEKL